MQTNVLSCKELRLPCSPEQHAKLATRCLRISANNAHNSKTKKPATCSPELPYLRTSFQQKRATAQRLAPQQARNIYSSRLRRNRSAVPSRSPGELIQKRGRARPLYWPSGDRQGGPSEGPLDRLSLHRRRRFLSPRERKGGRAAPLVGTTRIKRKTQRFCKSTGYRGEAPQNPCTTCKVAKPRAPWGEAP